MILDSTSPFKIDVSNLQSDIGPDPGAFASAAGGPAPEGPDTDIPLAAIHAGTEMVLSGIAMAERSLASGRIATRGSSEPHCPDRETKISESAGKGLAQPPGPMR